MSQQLYRNSQKCDVLLLIYNTIFIYYTCKIKIKIHFYRGIYTIKIFFNDRLLAITF